MRKNFILLFLSLSMLWIAAPCLMSGSADCVSVAGASPAEEQGRRVKLYMQRPGYPAGEDYQRTVPVYKFRDDVVGNFFKQFCDTFSRLNELPLIEMVQPVGFACPGYEGNPSEYTALSSRLSNGIYLKRAVGAIPLDDGEVILITLNYPNYRRWLADIHLDETRDSITLKYEISKSVLVECNEAQYSAVLRVLNDKKVDPVSIRNVTLSIQNTREKRCFNWIEEYYKKNGLAPGCGYYNQFDFSKYCRENYDKMMPWLGRKVYMSDTIW